jgi:hypothetical protein
MVSTSGQVKVWRLATNTAGFAAAFAEVHRESERWVQNGD